MSVNKEKGKYNFNNSVFLLENNIDLFDIYNVSGKFSLSSWWVRGMNFIQ